MFSANTSEASWVYREEVEIKDRTRRCDVVAGEYEKIDLRHSETFELFPACDFIFDRRYRVLSEVVLESQV